jgi:hypothetical protein
VRWGAPMQVRSAAISYGPIPRSRPSSFPPIVRGADRRADRRCCSNRCSEGLRSIVRKLAANYRTIVAAPDYLESRGTPSVREDLLSYECLLYRRSGGCHGGGARQCAPFAQPSRTMRIFSSAHVSSSRRPPSRATPRQLIKVGPAKGLDRKQIAPACTARARVVSSGKAVMNMNGAP